MDNSLESPTIYILAREEFQKVYEQLKYNFKNVPTPAITIFDQGVTKIAQIFIDESFLPEDKFAEYAYLLASHELAESDYNFQHPELIAKNQQNLAAGQELDYSGHKVALKEELRLASAMDLLDEYQNHWREWLNSHITDEISKEIKQAIEERLSWREDAYNEVNTELHGENTEIKK